MKKTYPIRGETRVFDDKYIHSEIDIEYDLVIEDLGVEDSSKQNVFEATLNTIKECTNFELHYELNGFFEKLLKKKVPLFEKYFQFKGINITSYTKRHICKLWEN